MKRIRYFLGIILFLIIVIYALGPKPKKPELRKDLPSISASMGDIEKFVENNDADLPIKKDNGSRIIWADELKKERTPYSLLYLHGFSASWYEGYPAHIKFAETFGCNLYLPRLASHGIETEEALLDMTPDRLWESAKEALMVACTLGEKVIIMSTSTGGTLGLKLACDFPQYVDGLILYSPNIRINKGRAFLLSKPWGLQIARKSNGGKYRITNEDLGSKDCQYWYCKYRMEALVYLQQLIDVTMKKKTYKNVTAPVFMGYYYKDENNQDESVKVSAMLKMYTQLGTSPDLKVKKAFPEAGTHVIVSELFSGALDEVVAETIKFGTEVLKLKVVK